uniref:hypothetical protein n=1 Tax=Aeromonas sp. Ne-1 TaxID=1675689 RepID=UPI001565C746|nr:hypothetical protein [Aeromonas sp. Ne-1]
MNDKEKIEKAVRQAKIDMLNWVTEKLYEFEIEENYSLENLHEDIRDKLNLESN